MGASPGSGRMPKTHTAPSKAGKAPRRDAKGCGNDRALQEESKERRKTHQWWFNDILAHLAEQHLEIEKHTKGKARAKLFLDEFKSDNINLNKVKELVQDDNKNTVTAKGSVQIYYKGLSTSCSRFAQTERTSTQFISI